MNSENSPNNFAGTCNMEMFVDHVGDLSSSKRSIVCCGCLLFQMTLFLKFEISKIFFNAVAILACNISKLGYYFSVIECDVLGSSVP